MTDNKPRNVPHGAEVSRRRGLLFSGIHWIWAICAIAFWAIAFYLVYEKVYVPLYGDATSEYLRPGFVAGPPAVRRMGESIDASREKMRTALVGMGYTNIEIEGCELKYSKEFEPTRENNFYTHFDKFVLLDSLKSFNQIYAQRLVPNGIMYELRLRTWDSYLDTSFEYWQFELRISREYPNLYWPYIRPSDYTPFISEIERELHASVPSLKRLNRSVAHTQFGTTTVADGLRSVIRSFQKEPLLAFRAAVRDYIFQSSCFG